MVYREILTKLVNFTFWCANGIGNTGGKQRLPLKSVLQPLPPPDRLWPCALDRPFAVFPSTVSSAWMRYRRTDKHTGRRWRGRGNATAQHQDHFLLPGVHVSAPNCQNQTRWGWREGLTSRSEACARSLATARWRLLMPRGPCVGSFLCMAMCVSSCWLTKALTLLTGLPIDLQPVEHISQPRTVQEFTDAPIKVREGIPLEIIWSPLSMPIQNSKCTDQPDILFCLWFWL